MQIVDTTKSPWELIVPNTRGGDVYRKVIVAGDQRPALLFTTAGEFTGNGQSFGALAGLWAAPGEPITLHATAGSELLKVRFPAPSSRITLTQDERSLRAPQSI